jgi:branched-chain amino acid aminotransferase
MASYYNENTVLFLNGEFVKAADAKMDLYSQSLHYGYSVFEGIRSYKTEDGTAKIFKAKEHFDRFKASAQAINLPYTYNTESLIESTNTLLALNNLGDAYIRPVVYAPANMSFTQNTESFVFIQAWEMGPFLGDKRIRVMTSSFQRPNPKGFKIHAKAAGHYVNSIMASQEAKAAGYDEALLLDMHDHVAEAPGANVFFEKDGTLYTPSLGNILPGITRATVIELCASHAIPVVETSFGIDAIKGSDAAFFCGTAAEVIGLESIDDVPFIKNWDDTASRKIQSAYQKLVRTNS